VNLPDFHKRRRIFIFHDGRFHFAPPGYPGTHLDWLTEYPIEGTTPEDLMKYNVRGYLDHTGLYFYHGPDFECSQSAAETALEHLPFIARTLDIPVGTPVYGGVLMAIPGVRWSPRAQIGVVGVHMQKPEPRAEKPDTSLLSTEERIRRLTEDFQALGVSPAIVNTGLTIIKALVKAKEDLKSKPAPAVTHKSEDLSIQIIRGHAASLTISENPEHAHLGNIILRVMNYLTMGRDEVLTNVLEEHREDLGRLVRKVWVAWALQQPAVKESWLVPWEELLEDVKEVDRRIGVALALKGLEIFFSPGDET
jgi:hypothetical protein